MKLTRTNPRQPEPSRRGTWIDRVDNFDLRITYNDRTFVGTVGTWHYLPNHPAEPCLASAIETMYLDKVATQFLEWETGHLMSRPFPSHQVLL